MIFKSIAAAIVGLFFGVGFFLQTQIEGNKGPSAPKIRPNLAALKSRLTNLESKGRRPTAFANALATARKEQARNIPESDLEKNIDLAFRENQIDPRQEREVLASLNNNRDEVLIVLQDMLEDPDLRVEDKQKALNLALRMDFSQEIKKELLTVEILRQDPDQRSGTLLIVMALETYINKYQDENLADIIEEARDLHADNPVVRSYLNRRFGNQ